MNNYIKIIFYFISRGIYTAQYYISKWVQITLIRSNTIKYKVFKTFSTSDNLNGKVDTGRISLHINFNDKVENFH